MPQKAVLGALGTAAGGIAGAIGSHGSQSVTAGPMNAGVMNDASGNSFGNVGAQDIYAANGAFRQQAADAGQYNGGGQAGLAQMLQMYAQNGGLPNQQQIGAANQYASQLLAPQFQQAQQNTDRRAAALGRPTNDPILQGKLAQYMGQQQGTLANQLAMQMPDRQLGFQQMLANQAMQNQMQLFGLGSGMIGQAQQYSLGLANKQTQSGGGLRGGLLGALTGLGGGLDLAGKFGGGGGLFGGGGGLFGGVGGMGETNFSGAPSSPTQSFAQDYNNMFNPNQTMSMGP